MGLQILRWWLTVELIGILALPLSLALFRRLPDRGYGLAKPLGILLISYGTWLLAMLGFGSLSVGLLLGSGLAVLLLGWYATVRARLDLRATLRSIMPAIIVHDALFVLLLGVGLLLRWRGIYGTQINHTETPMDFAFLNAILASRSFPPQDPWLANYPINYYYFGYVMIAALTRLSGLASGVAFNLAGATIYALAGTGIAGLIWNLIGLERPAKVADETSARPRRVPLGQIGAGLAAVVLVLVAANQVGALQWLTRSEQVVALQGAEVVPVLAQSGGSNPITLSRPLPAMPWTQEWAGLTTLTRATTRADAVSWWWPSRAVWDDLRGADGQDYRIYTITEFPLFSFMLGDLHPHVLSLPWTLLAMAFALNLLTRSSAPEWLRPALGRIELFVTAVTLGGLYAINSWDLPTYLLLFAGALLLLYLRLAPEPGRVVWPHFMTQGGAMLMAAWLLWLPFHMSFVSLVGGNGAPIGISPTRTPLMQFLIIFGLFIIPLVALVLHSSSRTTSTGRPTVLIALAGGAGLLAVGVVIDFALLGLLPFAIWAIVLATRETARPARAFALWCTAMGALVIFGTEIVYLRDAFEGQTPRMNTLFKFYYQVWLIWGTLAGYALWVLLRRPRLAMIAWLAPFAVLLVGALVYPAVVLPRNGADRTFDGTDFITREHPADAAAISWIRDNTPGDALVLQAPLTGSYDPRNAMIATATGRPTLIGWRGHEDQWRAGQPEVFDTFGARVTDATTIYVTTDVEAARELVEEYGIDYVYVGPMEQQFVESEGAPSEALAKFAEFMDVAWSGEGATIYGRR